MSKNLSPTARSILTLLNNVRDLIIQSSDRQSAAKVMRAMLKFAQEKNYTLPDDKIETFMDTLIDSKPYTLSSILHDIAADVIASDKTQ